MKKFSIISTCFNEELNIRDCYNEVKKIFKNKNLEYEHIFSDNNSSDSSVKIIKEICVKDKNVKLLRNAKNYGPFLNNFNALCSTSGDYIVVNYACDMQDPPDVLEKMIDTIQEGCDCVYGVKNDSNENFILKFIRKTYYFMVNNLSGKNVILENSNEFLCVNRSVLNEIISNYDYFPYIRGYISKITDNYKTVKFVREKRKKGKSKNSIFDLFKQGINGLISTMENIIYLSTIIFFSLSLILLLFAIYTFFLKIFIPNSAPQGIATLVLITSIGFSFAMLMLSLILQYLIAIHNQVRFKFKVRVIEKINF
jgi:polyisoprenyl-phosphate glycosyltransferase